MYTSYHSACHAFCLVVQLLKGAELALSCTELVYETPNPDGLVTPDEVRDWLRILGLDAVVVPVRATGRSTLFHTAAAHHWPILVICPNGPVPQDSRWGVVDTWRGIPHGINLCIDKGEEALWPGAMEPQALPDVILVRQRVGTPTSAVIRTLDGDVVTRVYN